VFELLLLTLIMAGAAHAFWHLRAHGYLPQPFIWDPQDTFMDWFNPAYWAHREGIYSVWRAVYPPLSFALLKFLTVSSCYVSSPFAGRDCDVLGQALVVMFYALAIAASYRAIRLVQPQAALLRTVALAFGLPGLFVLERGNLLILCQLCLAAVVVPGMTNRWVRALAAGTMINLKPYLLFPTLAWAVRRDWRQLELAGIATVALYCVSWAIVGSGSVLEIAANTTNWVRVTGSDVVAEMFYTTSFNNMLGVFDRGFPILRFIGSREYELFRFVIQLATMVSQATAVVAVLLAWLRPQTLPQARIALLLLLLSLTWRSPGGYSELLVVFLVFLERWSGIAAIVAIVTAYLISIPYEWIISSLPTIHTWSWLTGEAVTALFGIGIGQFARPIGLLLILLVLSLDSIVKVTCGLRADHIRRSAQPRPLAA
jgi:hypothetical protein